MKQLLSYVKICVAVSFVGMFACVLWVSSALAKAAQCPANAELYAGGSLCRCSIGFIENRGMCRQFDIGTAKVRAVELRRSEASDCQAMTQIFNEFSRAAEFKVGKVVQYAGQVLSNGIVLRRGGVHKTLVPLVSENYAVVFKDSGFLPQYRDDSNQVRHFVAYFAVGAKYDLPTATAFLAEIRDSGQQEDIDLGNIASALGRQAAGSVHSMKNLGRALNSQVCRK